jgi:adenine deaminase
MDCSSVIEGSPEMHDKLQLFGGKILDGHAPFLSDQDLQAYVMAGIATDHECSDFEYAMQERRNGLTVLIREGSAAKNLEAIVTGIVKNHVNTEGFCFCTDDKHIEDIDKDGHIDFNVRKAVWLGIDPIRAIKMATIQPARCYGLNHIGAVAAGYQADLIVFDNLYDLQAEEVYFKGCRIEKNKKDIIGACPPELKNTVHVGGFSRDKLKLKKAEQYHVIGMEEGQITTRDILWDRSSDDECKANKEFQKIAVVERHKATGKVGVGVVSGFGIKNGAIASSVSHDSHNIIVIGDNDEDMEHAVNELIRSQGGYTIVCDHKIYETLELPIMGLMSDAGFETVNKKLKKMIAKAHEMGVPQGMEPFITLSFMALPVIQEIRITPRGIYNVVEGIFYED